MGNRYFELAFAFLFLFFINGCAVTMQGPTSLNDWRVVDLTHTLDTDMPIWPGDPQYEKKSWANYEEDGYFINRLSIGEHSGTHWGTPNTFLKGARAADQFSAQELVIPAVVIDVRETASSNPDYQLSVEDVKAWESQYGEVAAGSLIILLTGWQHKWVNPDLYLGLDEDNSMHWPGFSSEAARFLVKERAVVALGTDTHGVDPGNSSDFGAGMAISEANGMVLECLAAVDQLPAVGATLVIGGWPIKGGTGSPARVFALLPPH